jgi:hypothetical protein
MPLSVWIPLEVLLRNAAKARLMRWVRPKTKRVDREAPDVVKGEWSKGNRNALADLFSQANFQEDRHAQHICLSIFGDECSHVWIFENF